jgi:cytochrome c5
MNRAESILRQTAVSLMAIMSVFIYIKAAGAADVPHNSGQGMQCSSSVGDGLTTYASNAKLCTTCHQDNAAGAAKPFKDEDQAVPGVSGTSHSWTRVIDPSQTPEQFGPNSRYGLRKPAANEANPQPDEIQSYAMNVRLQAFDYGITCSVCHNQHWHDAEPWNPRASAKRLNEVSSTGTTSGTATQDGGDSVTVIDSNQTWTGDEWIGFWVTMTNWSTKNRQRRIVDNTATTLTVSPGFDDVTFNEVLQDDTYRIESRRNFMRENMQNMNPAKNLNNICEDCHYYRTHNAGQTNTRVYDGTKKSHPIAKIFTDDTGRDVITAIQFKDRPRKPPKTGWQEQTGERYSETGMDNNPTNNIGIDSSMQVRCISCHNIHYVDSDSSTYDRPN